MQGLFGVLLQSQKRGEKMRKLKLWVKAFLLYEAIFVPLAFLVAKSWLVAAVGVIVTSVFGFVCFALIGELLRKTDKILPIKKQEPQPDFSAAFALFDKMEVQQ